MEYRIIRGGILIIGSLLWDRTEVREQWRARRLDLARARKVQVPIRYGRRSASRNQTYTMVFSSRCEAEGKLGQGYAVPFRDPVAPNFQEVCRHALALISAEKQEWEKKEPRYFHWEWGSLGLLTNPFSERHPGQRGQEILDLRLRWEKKFSKDFDPAPYRMDPDEAPVLSRKGRLRITWPGNLPDLDFLLAVATQPNLPSARYPSPQAIAEAMIEADDFAYFIENQEAEIFTFQDEKVRSFLPVGVTR